jgi:hypothetical protein
MAITIGAPTCWPIQNWAVFRFTAGVWQLVLNTPAYLVPPLVAVGSDIRETTAVSRAGDPRCFPSGGTHARIWHWNGTSLVAGPWKQVTAGTPKPKEAPLFKSPSGNISCWMDTFPSSGVMGCQSQKAPRRVNMDAHGRLKICKGARCAGCGCDPPKVITLAYGRQITFGRFRCRSQQAGVACTVIGLGKGFLINSSGVRRLVP